MLTRILISLAIAALVFAFLRWTDAKIKESVNEGSGPPAV